MKLDVTNLAKSFGNKKVFNEFSYQFNKGCCAVTGKNGVGKSTLLEILAGARCQDDGLVYLSHIGHNNSVEYKKKLTYVPSKPAFFPSVTGHEFLNFVSSVKNKKDNLSRLDKLINDFNIRRFLSTRFDEMSLGTQKKIFLSTLGIAHAELIILDEPTNALDNESKEVFFANIKNLSEASIIIMATHDERLLNEINPIILDLNQLY